MSCSTPSISPRRLISTATEAPQASRHMKSTGPIAVGSTPSYQRQPLGQRGEVLGEQLLEVLLDAVLLQAGVDPEVVHGVVVDDLEQDPQRVVVLAGDGPLDHAVVVGALDHLLQGSDIQFSGL